jgi:hypothetical protein
MNSVYKYIVYLYIIFFVISFAACGGGSGNSGQTDNDTPNQPSSENVNGGLTGRIFVGDGWIVDIPTGRSTRIPGIWWDDDCDGCSLGNNDSYGSYGANANYLAKSNIDGTEFLLSIFDCNPNYRRDCLVIHDFEGSNLGDGWVNEGLNFGAKLSNDSNYIAFTYNPESNETVFGGPTQLHIVDREFRIVSSITMPDNSNVVFDWANNGQLVYGYDGVFYITAPYNTVGTPIYSFLDTEGNLTIGLGPPHVSPDSTRIAFIIIREGNQLSYTTSEIWVMDIDGTDLHRLVHTPGDSTQNYNSLAWSPDGEYILAEEGGAKGGVTGVPSGVIDRLYAIPSMSRDVELNDNGENGIIRIRNDYRSHNGTLRYTFGATCSYSWIP